MSRVIAYLITHTSDSTRFPDDLDFQSLTPADKEAGFVETPLVAVADPATDLLGPLKRLVLAYVNLLEAGRDRIVSLGGQCDPVDVMEAGSPPLIAAKAAIARAEVAS